MRNIANSLKINNPVMRNAVLKGEWKEGPPSLKSRRAKLAYNSPNGLNEAFNLAKDVIKKDSKMHYVAAQREAMTNNEKINKKRLNYHMVKAELHNPEVQYNYKTKQMDFNHPVYRYLAHRDWSQYEMLILLQRLETLHVIPDTLPTIKPRAKVDLQFPGVVNKWIEPGKILRNSVCEKTPILKVQEFEQLPEEGGLYTVLIVDPDTPDLKTDSFSTTLHWAVTNVPLSNTQFNVDVTKSDELVSYLPPHPEKNSPTHRYCVWVFRQNSKNEKLTVDPAHVERQHFDIRSFASNYKLDAVGAHVWRCDYDRSTDQVREKFGLGLGNVYRRVRNITL